MALVSALTMPLANPDPAQRLKTRGLILLGLVCLIPIALPAMAQLGLLERFITDGYVDDSANARVEIYRIFGLVEWRDILLGADPLWIKKLAFEKLGFEFIESPVVMFVFQFGALGAAALFCTILMSLWRLAAGSDWRAALGVVAFLLCALSNNTLSSKNQAIVMMVVLCLAYRRDDAPAADGRHDRARSQAGARRMAGAALAAPTGGRAHAGAPCFAAAPASTT